ncbi:MAG TPA: hypothetical protein ENJ83_05945 [Rhodospirillales bacterium]|nr:hypothetical protein [Rhodospirillales bacterium]
MWRRLRPWLEVLLAQLAILALSWPLGFALAALLALLMVFSGLVPLGPEGFGILGALILTMAPAMVLVFLLLWVLAWRLRFRQRMTLGRFLLAWGLSLLLVPLFWALWSILDGYYLTG